MGKTCIEWTDRTWNPTRGCTRVSEGCRNCYAERIAARFSTHALQTDDEPGGTFGGFAKMTAAGPRWTGRVELIASKLDEPLRWRPPQRIFVNSMSDLFHEALPDEAIAAVFVIMALARHHTFQVLTKRAERMREFMEDRYRPGLINDVRLTRYRGIGAFAEQIEDWPLPNVWLGVSVEDQATADERIPLLLHTPAAKRFVSYEPALGPVDFGAFLPRPLYHCQRCGCELRRPEHPRCGTFDNTATNQIIGLDQIIVGGESGPGARPFDLAWARSVIEQCRADGVACFVKQLGARPIASAGPLPVPQSAESLMRYGEYDPDPLEFQLRDRKGGDMSEWPEDLRVREMPA